MATKNCPKCDSPNPVACKKCVCGHVFFATRRSANTLAAESAEDISEPTTPQEPEIPRRRTARVTRERPQFYDALQVENQTRRQRELQKRRKASKSDEVDVSAEDIPEKVPVASTAKRRAESPPSKVYEQPVKKRRGRPPGLTNRKTGRAQILSNKPTDTKTTDGTNAGPDDELENVANIHDVPALKALQMSLVLSDINSRISSSGVKAEAHLPPAVDSDISDAPEKEVEEPEAEPMECDDTVKQEPSTEPSKTVKKEPVAVEKEKVEKRSEDTVSVELEESKKKAEIVIVKSKKLAIDEENEKGHASGEEAEDKTPLDIEKEIEPAKEEKKEVLTGSVKEETNDKLGNVVIPIEKLKSDDLEDEAKAKDSKNGTKNTAEDKPAKGEAELKEGPMNSSDLKEAKIEPKLESAEEPTQEKDTTDKKPATGTNGVNDDDSSCNDVGGEEKKNIDTIETDKSKAEQVSGLAATPAESRESKICSS